MLQVYGCGDGGFLPLGVEGGEICALLKAYSCLWIDSVDEDMEKVRLILEKVFGEGAGLSEATSIPSIRFLRAYSEVTVVLLPRSIGEEAGEVRALFDPKVLVTIRSRLSNALIEETVQSLKNLADSHPIDIDLIFCRLLEEIVDNNEFYTDKLRDAVDRLERKAVVEEAGKILGRVEDYERRLGKAHDILQGQRLIVLNSVERLLPNMGKTDVSRTILLRAEHRVERQLDLVDHYDHELSGVISLNDLTLTIRLTRIMTLLTVIATVLLLPNTVATIFGIPSLPVPSQAWGLITTTIIVSGLIPTIYLYKKGWLKP